MAKTKSSSKTSASKPTAATPGTASRQGTSGSAGGSKYTALFAKRFRSDLTVGALFGELAGTFALTAVLLVTAGNAIIAGITVLLFVMVLSRVSGGHINPVVTVLLLALRKIPLLRACGFIVAQLLGAMLAYMVVAQFVQTAPTVQVPNQFTGETMEVPGQEMFSASPLNGEWRPFLAEGLGAVIFGFGIAAAVLNRREGLEAGFLIGGTLIIGLLLATQASAAIINPAVAVGLEAYTAENWWTVGVYAIAPLIGGVVGGLLFKLFNRDAIEKTPQAA